MKAYQSREPSHDKDDWYQEIEDLELFAGVPGKSSRTHGGGEGAAHPGKVALTARLATRLGESEPDGADSRPPAPSDEWQRSLQRLRARVASWLGVPESALPVRADQSARERTSRRATPGLMADGVIHVDPATFRPDTRAGHEIFAHEAVHVAQRGNPAQAASAGEGEAEAEAYLLGRAFATNEPRRAPVEHVPTHAAAAYTDAERVDEAAYRRSLAARALAMAKKGERIFLPHRRELESRFGRNFERVEVYTGDAAAQACRMVGARAFAAGHVIALTDPNADIEVVAHELVHVIQQGGDRGPVVLRDDLAMTEPGDAVERAANAEKSAVRGGAGPLGVEVVAQPGAVLARDGDGTPEWPESDPAPVNAELFWNAAQAYYDLAEAQDLFQVFGTHRGDAQWSVIANNLGLYQQTMAVDPTPTADASVVPVFCSLLTYDPSIQSYSANFPLFWSNGRSVRGWGLDVMPAIYFRAVSDTYPLEFSDVATKLSHAYWSDIAAVRWPDSIEGLNVLPGYLHFLENAPLDLRSADTFLQFSAPFVNNADIDEFRRMVISTFDPATLLSIAPDMSIFWSGGTTAQQISGLYATHESLLIQRDLATDPINWLTTAAGGLDTLNTTPIGPYLTTTPLFDMQYPTSFNYSLGKGTVFWQAISSIVAARALGTVHVVLVGLPRAESVLLDVEMPKLIELMGSGAVSGFDFLCFNQEYASKFTSNTSWDSADPPQPSNLMSLLTDQYNGATATTLSEARDWMNEQGGVGSDLSDKMDTLIAQWNPVLSIPLGDQGQLGTHVSVTDDLLAGPLGFTLVSLDADIAADRPALAGPATVVADLDAAEAFSIPGVTYELAPSEGNVHAVADNTIGEHNQGVSLFGGLFNGIDLDWDVHVVDGGLELEVTLADAIPLGGGLSITAGGGSLFYTGADGLGGAVSVTVSNGSTITGTVELVYREAGWLVCGTLEVTGLVPGLPAVAVAMEYAGPDDWRVGLAEGAIVSVATELYGIPLAGVITQLEMSSSPAPNGGADQAGDAATSEAGDAATSEAGVGFSASGTLTADLPLVGSVTAGIAIANNQLQTLSLSATRGFQYPAANPILSGNVSGDAVYDVPSGQLTGDISGTATVNVPGADPIGLNFGLRGGGEGGLSAYACLASEVDINRFLRLKTLDATYEEGLFALTGSAEVQNLGTVSGSVAVRLDDNGFSVTDARVTIGGADDALSGEATFHYNATDGFGFAGHVDLRVAEGMTVRAGIEYPSTDAESGVAEDGTINAHVSLPPEADEGAVAGAGPAGWQLWPGREPGAPVSLLGEAAPDMSIPIFSIGVATATVEISADLLYQLSVDPLTVSGSVDVEGLDLTTGSFSRVVVTGAAQSGLTGQLIFRPAVGLGLSVVHPFLAGISGGLSMPVTATAGVSIGGDLTLEYRPGQELDAQQAIIRAPLTFSLDATPSLYATVEALGGILSHEWDSGPLTTISIIDQKQLLEVVFDLANPQAGLTIETFGMEETASSAASGPDGMEFDEREATQVPASGSAEASEGQASGETPAPGAPAAEGTTSGGGFDFTALVAALGSAMPEPVVGLLDTLTSVYEAIEPIIDSVVSFLETCAGFINEVLANDEVTTLLTEVLPGLASGDGTNLLDLLNSASDIGLSILRGLASRLTQTGDIAIIRRRKDISFSILGMEADLNPDEYSYRFHIPGIIDIQGVGESAILSGVVRFLNEVLGIEVSDIDEVEPPHMFAYFADEHGEGDVIGSSSDAPQLIEGGVHFHHDQMSSIAGYGVTPGTYVHLYEESNRGGDKTTIHFGSAPEQEESVDEDGLSHRSVPTVLVRHISQAGGGDGYDITIHGKSVEDKVSTVEIRMDANAHEITADEQDGPGYVYLMNDERQAYWGTRAETQETNFWTGGQFGNERDYYNDSSRVAMLSNLPAGARVEFYANGGGSPRDDDYLLITVLEALGDESLFIDFAAPDSISDPRVSAEYVSVGDERLDGNVSRVFIYAAAQETTESSD